MSNEPGVSSRRKARELALCASYAFELSENEVEYVTKDMIEGKDNRKAVIQFAEKLFLTVVEHMPELDEIIKQKALNWEFNRIAIIDKMILRIALSEFLYFPDIPPKVSIDEAIEISKMYSTSKSGKFINGILDTVLDELRKNGSIQKTGRGLMNG
ncbi:MAG: transcription antitermination factor NusB [Candidatus Zhuqueibacterota bacterium]